MQTALFDYNLPPELIAQQPAEPRDSSRLLVLDRASGQIEHRHFRDIGDYLRAGDLLVANNSRVIPARLHGRKASGGSVEIFLLRQLDETGSEWECLVRGKRLNTGTQIKLTEVEAAAETRDNTEHSLLATRHSPLLATITAIHETGQRTVRFSAPIRPYLDELGEMPLPPYITTYAGDRERYQTIYSQPEGSVAAPTAGLHFTPELLLQLRQQGVLFDTVTLHVGLDTFKPVTAERIADHQIHSEWAAMSSATARQINAVTLQGGRVVAVGTTTTRTLEWASQMRNAECGVANADAASTPHSPLRTPPADCPWQRVAAFTGNVNLFIHPGYRFRAVDRLITNFHLPRSTLLMLVSAFIGQAYPDNPDRGRELLLQTYEVAKAEGYRFYSFGDAMLIL